MIILFNKMSAYFALVLLGTILLGGLGCKQPQAGNQHYEPTSSGALGENSHVNSASEFVVLLKGVIERNDRKRLIAITQFPIQVQGTGMMPDASAFLGEYDKIWRSEVVKAVLDENPDHFGSGHRFTIGCGEVGFQKTKDQEFRITEFNVSAYSNAGITVADCYRAREFFMRLQSAIASDNRQEVAGMLKYPLHFHGQARTITLRNARDAIQNYDLIFSTRLRRAVANQKAWDLPSQSDGVAIGDGFIWFNEPTENGTFQVTSIFEPPLHY
jgi:hypothetical protein